LEAIYKIINKYIKVLFIAPNKMNKKDLDSLNELYLSVYDGEQLNEAPLTPEQIKYKNERAQLGVISKGGRFVATGKVDPNLTSDWEWMTSSQAGKRQQLRAQKLAADLNKGQRETRISRAQNAAIAAADKVEKEKAEKARIQPAGSPPTRPAAGGSTPPTRPAASGPVLSKKNGVEGTGVGANFKARAFTAAEKSRYASVAAQNAARNSASSTSTPKPPTPAIGKLGNTSFERRTPTSAELRAAQGARDKGASPEKALQAAQKTNLPTTGPTPAVPDMKSAAADLQKFTPRDMSKYPLKPATGINNTKPKPTAMTQSNSYEWNTAKTLRDIAGAYNEIYEAKKKDQDQDGDNDFADVRIARMIASGMSKAEAIAAVRNKSYNEETSLDEATAMAKRGHDETAIRNRIAKSTGGGKFADKATALENRPTYGDSAKQKARQNLARAQRGDFRKTTSSSPGLHGYAHKSDDPAVKAKQAARGAQRGALTPREKKQLNREAYEAYEFVASYLLENNFASTVEDANVIINNMSEGWFNQIMEG
jgi:hypothetical protein